MHKNDPYSASDEALKVKKRKASIVARLFWWMTGIFVAIHVYALALKIVPVPGTFLMAQRAVGGETIKRNWTRLEDISPFVVSAVIAAEDSRFCSHEGIDWDAISEAISDNESRKRRRGGSTITQQTAKNVFLWNGGGFIRKIPETWMASFIDYTWGKKRVIEVYLNIAEWGDGIFGVEAAARARFNTSAKDLTPRQAALLASVLPSPNKWRLDPPGNYVNSRARTLQARLYVVRNEGYANCVLGKPEKKIGPARKQKPASLPATLGQADTQEDEPVKNEESALPKEQNLSTSEPDISDGVAEPILEEPEIIAPESEEDEGIVINPE